MTQGRKVVGVGGDDLSDQKPFPLVRIPQAMLFQMCGMGLGIPHRWTGQGHSEMFIHPEGSF